MENIGHWSIKRKVMAVVGVGAYAFMVGHMVFQYFWGQ